LASSGDSTLTLLADKIKGKKCKKNPGGCGMTHELHIKKTVITFHLFIREICMSGMSFTCVSSC